MEGRFIPLNNFDYLPNYLVNSHFSIFKNLINYNLTVIFNIQ